VHDIWLEFPCQHSDLRTLSQIPSRWKGDGNDSNAGVAQRTQKRVIILTLSYNRYNVNIVSAPVVTDGQVLNDLVCATDLGWRYYVYDN
jgi:hypothetical protein